MDFREAQDYLIHLTKFGFNFGLGRVQELLKRNGNPHLKLKVIHVGGTNGKGSTCAMISTILTEAGYKTGLFTSPHLHSYCERFMIDGVPINPSKMAELITRLKPQLEQMVIDGFEHPTEFEVSTAAAFIYFLEQKVDFLVLEVGLGGSIDSTNVVTPLVSVITNVSMDHMDYLGNTVEAIARVKAGIIKENVPVVTATDAPKALQVITQVAAQHNAKLIIVDQDHLEGLSTVLLGSHQVINAGTALATLQCLKQYNIDIPENAIRQGLAHVKWPARLEIIATSPNVLLDGAHNEAGAITLAKALRENFTYNNLILVIGMLDDKEREKVVSHLAPLAKTVLVTKPNSPRAGAWQGIADVVREYVSDVTVVNDVHKAVRTAIKIAQPDDLVCVTGSLYMVAEAREIFL